MTEDTDEPTDDRPWGSRRLGRLLVDPAPLRLDRDFRLLWIGQSISTLGRTFTLVAIPYQVYVLTGDVLAVGVLSIVQLAAMLTFTLGGGAVADAVDRRKLLLVTQLGQAGCSLAFLAIALTAAPSLPAIYALMFVSTALGAIDAPARSAALPRLVPAERLQAAIGLNQLAFNAAWVIGPAIGGIVLAPSGVVAAYAIDVVTFASVIVALLLISPIPRRGRRRPPECRGRGRWAAVRQAATRGVRDVRRGHQRDGLRVADVAVSGARPGRVHGR